VAKKFTKKEITLLKENPYTLSVSESTLKFTKDFKDGQFGRSKAPIGYPLLKSMILFPNCIIILKFIGDKPFFFFRTIHNRMSQAIVSKCADVGI